MTAADLVSPLAARHAVTVDGHLVGVEARVARVDGLGALAALHPAAEVARAGNFMETRRVGEEHATLERALRELYDEWAQRSEAE